MSSNAGNDELSALVRGFAETPGHLIRRAYQAHNQLWAEVVPVDITGSQYLRQRLIRTETDQRL